MRLLCETSGANFFAKIGTTPDTSKGLNREIQVYNSLNGDFMPRLIAWETDESAPILIIAAIMTVSLMRFGMVAFCAYLFFFRLVWFSPLTTDVSAFYFNATVFSAVAVIGLAFYGFYTSLAGQPIFERKFLSEENA